MRCAAVGLAAPKIVPKVGSSSGIPTESCGCAESSAAAAGAIAIAIWARSVPFPKCSRSESAAEPKRALRTASTRIQRSGYFFTAARFFCSQQAAAAAICGVAAEVPAPSKSISAGQAYLAHAVLGV